MPKRTVITLVEAIVIIIVFLYAFAIFLPYSGRVKPGAMRVVCGTNLKGIGTAFGVYANDHKGKFPQLPGTGPWSKQLGFAYDLAKPDFKEGGAQCNVDRTITASWYLLTREADVSPKSFVCSWAGDVTGFDGNNPNNRDLVELWDFGSEPNKHVSYAMHNPYGAYPATEKLPKSFAIAADMSPWFRQGEIVSPDTSNQNWQLNRTLLPPYFSDRSITKQKIQQSNSFSHNRQGQNVLFADGSVAFMKITDYGGNHDNIYTYWSTPNNPTENDIRIGTNPTSRNKENDAQSPEDSFLAI